MGGVRAESKRCVATCGLLAFRACLLDLRLDFKFNLNLNLNLIPSPHWPTVLFLPALATRSNNFKLTWLLKLLSPQYSVAPLLRSSPGLPAVPVQ